MYIVQHPRRRANPPLHRLSRAEKGFDIVAGEGVAVDAGPSAAALALTTHETPLILIPVGEKHGPLAWAKAR